MPVSGSFFSPTPGQGVFACSSMCALLSRGVAVYVPLPILPPCWTLKSARECFLCAITEVSPKNGGIAFFNHTICKCHRNNSKHVCCFNSAVSF